MSEELKPSEETKLTSPSVAQVTQVINNAIALLMDVANLLRDFPKLIQSNENLAAKLVELDVLDPKTGLFK